MKRCLDECGNSRSSALFEYLDGWHVLIPGWDVPHTKFELPLPDGSTAQFSVRLYEDFYRYVERIESEIPDDADDLADDGLTPEETIEFHMN